MKLNTFLKMLSVAVGILLLSAQSFATPSVSVTKDYGVLWVHSPAQFTPVSATVTDNGSPLSGVTVSFSTTLGSVSPSSAQTGGDGKATTTLTGTTSGSGGTATVTASVTINQQQYSGNTTVKFTVGSWVPNEEDEVGGIGSVSWYASVGGCYEAWVNGESLYYSGEEIVTDNEVNVGSDMYGTSAFSSGSGQSLFRLDRTWEGNVNNTVNPPPSRIKVREYYTADRYVYITPGAKGASPVGSAQAQAATKDSVAYTDWATRTCSLTVPSPPNYPQWSGADDWDDNPVFDNWIDSSSGSIFHAFSIFSQINTTISTSQQGIMHNYAEATTMGSQSITN